MLDDMTREEVVAVLDTLVDQLLGEAGVSGPPVDAISLAQKHLGMTIVMDRNQADRGRAQRTGGRQRIYLRPEPLEERHQWTVAHEIGQHLKDEIQSQLSIDEEQAKTLMGESLNTLFCSRLLVPFMWFRDDAKALDYSLPDLKKKYSTASNEVIALRMLDLPFPTIITVVDNEEISRRKSNGPKFKETELEDIEQRCQNRVRQTGEANTINEGHWTVQGWPLHKPDWKREILRTVVEES